MPDLEQVKSTVNQLLNQIPKGLSTQYMMLNVESDHKLSLDEFFSIATAVENRIADDAEVFYGNRIVDKSDHFWMGAIYVVG